jgi:hypothetical protein
MQVNGADVREFFVVEPVGFLGFCLIAKIIPRWQLIVYAFISIDSLEIQIISRSKRWLFQTSIRPNQIMVNHSSGPAFL